MFEIVAFVQAIRRADVHANKSPGLPQPGVDPKRNGFAHDNIPSPHAASYCGSSMLLQSKSYSPSPRSTMKNCVVPCFAFALQS